MSSETPDPTPAPAPRRGRAWVMIVVAGALASLGGVVALLLVVVAALDASRQPSLLPALAVMAISVVIGGLLAALAFRGLGVRAGWRSALLGALVGVVGVLLPWVAAGVIGRLGG